MPKKTVKDYPKNWRDIAESIKRKDKNTCQKCKLDFTIEEFTDARHAKLKHPESGNLVTLTVHHKDRNPMNCEIENLITLCSSCHTQEDWPLIRAEKHQEYLDECEAKGQGVLPV